MENDKMSLYKFDRLYGCIACLANYTEHDIRGALLEMRDELNRFFKDFKCTQVRISENTDCDFFGAYIVPYFENPEVLSKKILNPDYDLSSCPVKFDHYTLDLDSRLFNPLNGFTPHSIAALIIHDINELNTPTVIENYLCAVDAISAQSGYVLCKSSMMSDYWLCTFVMIETIRNMTSCFEFCTTDLIIADDFIISYGLRDAYDDGMEAVKFAKNKLNDQIKCPTLLLNWYITVYKMSNPIDKFIAVGEVIEDSIKFCGSRNLRSIMRNVVEFNKMRQDTDEEMYYRMVTESSNGKKKQKQSLITQIKKNGIKSIEDDIYEYRIRIKNLETEDDAVRLMREFNNRMGIITDYFANEDLTDTEKGRMYKLYDKYDSLREELSKKSTYNRKMYGLFVDYNALRQMTDANSMTMNTYY